MGGVTATDLFCGGGGSATGALDVGIEVKIAANHWDKAIETHALNHPQTEHDCADISQVEPRRYPRTDILWGSPECFTAGHLVMTQRGQVPIEDVKVGDMALTHEGRWRPVVRTQKRNNAKVVRVKGAGHTGITVTPNHRFWARSSDRVWNGNGYTRCYGVQDWMRVDRMLANEALWATPRIVEASANDPSKTLPDVFTNSPSGPWLLGRWLADGSLTFGRNHEVNIAAGYKDADELSEVLATTGVEWYRGDKRTAAVFSIGDEASRDWLHEQCGHGAAHKQLPWWVLQMPIVWRAQVLEGYMSGDGYRKGRRHAASTVSRALAVSMRLLAESLGHRVSMSHDKRTTYHIEGRTGAAQLQWLLGWEAEPSTTRALEAFEEGKHVWSRVRSVEELEETATVYNIEVEEDHSYVLDGIVVANCTNHSVAKGIARAKQQESLPGLWEEPLPSDAAIRSRATMWDIPRFAEVHNYPIVITENVVDAAKWVMFPAWLQAMDLLGYSHHIVWLNSMHAQLGGMPAPQSRDRMYVFFWKGIQRPKFERLRPLAICGEHGEVKAVQVFKKEDHWGRYRAQYTYRCPKCGLDVEPPWVPAASVIDWANLGTRIGDRKKPLSPKTMARIQAGIDRYWGHGPRTLVTDGIHGHGTVQDASDPLLTQTTAQTKGLLIPVEGREGKKARVVEETMRTQSTRLETGFVTQFRERHRNLDPHTEPLHTIVADGAAHALVGAPEALLMRNASVSSGDAGYLSTPVDEPMRTLLASGVPQSLLMPYYGKGKSKPASEPIGTLTTVDRYALVSSEKPDIEDCMFRMLTPEEVKRGMAFPSDYRAVGNGREQVRLWGNAVTPPAARALYTIAAEALAA